VPISDSDRLPAKKKMRYVGAADYWIDKLRMEVSVEPSLTEVLWRRKQEQSANRDYMREKKRRYRDGD
jgi:hypothetical protein